MNISQEDQLELKQTLIKSTNFLIEQLKIYASEISNSDRAIDDITTCDFDMKAHKHLTNLCLHLYDPEITSYSKKDFWKNCTYTRDIIWTLLGEFLSPKLFMKIETYLEMNEN